MKKLFVWALVATLAMAGSAMAGQGRNWHTSPDATFQFGVGGAAVGPTTTNNDDSCDISTAPAATLLLPYFEVDFNSTQSTARNTLFTITNVSALPQIAHVVVWTDWSFPAFDFNIFLTGYDVQSISLYDIFARGVIAPGASAEQPSGTTIEEEVPTNIPPGSQPFDNDENPNFLASAATSCATGVLPGQLPPGYVSDIKSIFTTGKTTTGTISCGSSQVGGVHANAIGYITVDVAATCSQSLMQPSYFTGEILFDNVLIGDYQDINPNATTGNFAGGNPMVHIRAIPEGGPAGSIPTGTTNLPFTFYDRYTPANNRRTDRRQPLPSTFAARWIQGGTGAFNSNYKIWREGFTPFPTACGNYLALNSNIAIVDLIRFDEHENARASTGTLNISPPPPGAPGLPETSSTSTASAQYPPLSSSGDVAGWMFLNLNNLGSSTYSTGGGPGAVRPGFAGAGTSTPLGNVRQSQNWVIVNMTAEGRFSVDFDAAWLGNGCSPSPAAGTQIGPAGGVLVCPPGAACTVVGNTYTNTTNGATGPAGTNTTP